MLIQKFSAMEFKISESTNGTQFNETLSYEVTSESGGVYDINVTLGIAEGNISASNNGTVLSGTEFGQTIPGSLAKEDFDSYMAIFGLEETYGGSVSVYTSSAFFHSTGSTSMRFGTTTFPVTTYVANSLPLTLSACGITSTLTAYTLQVGTPPGTSLLFITYLHITTTSPSTEDITFQLISMTAS
jgi:hypothetical protein